MNALGSIGELIAGRYLVKKGYRILNRGWRCKTGEIDLVAEKGGEIIFVEVKTRRSDGYGGAISAVGYNKAIRLRRAAYAYLQTESLWDCSFRIDVIGITIGWSKKISIEHLESVIED